MKQFWGITLTILTGLMLASCGQQSKSTDSSSSKVASSVQSKSSSQSSASAKSQSSSSTTSESSSSSAATSSSPSASASSAVTPQPQTSADRLTSLTQQLKAALPSALVPRAYPLTQGQVLNVSYTGTTDHYTMYFATSGSALAFNTASVNDNAAAIAISAQTYASAEAAEAQINYQAPETGLPTVALGDHLTATQQGAAGSTYTNWQEGRWSLTVQAINQNQEDGLPLSRQVVALLAKEYLPAPAGHGAIILRVNTGGLRLNRVTWRHGNVLYTATGVDALTLLQVVTSLK